MRPLLIVLAALWLTPAQALTFESLEEAGQRYTVIRVDLGVDRLELFPAPKGGQRFAELEQRLRRKGEKLSFAMNAGMFHPDYSPVGLLVVDGRQLRALNEAPDNPAVNFTTKPNGVFAVDGDRARVIESGLYKATAGTVRLASQSGPALVLKGRLHPRFRPKSKFRNIRNGVGVMSDGMPVFAISETAVTLYEFARFFRDRLGCSDALYFDGSVSSLHAPALDRSDSLQRLGPIIGTTE